MRRFLVLAAKDLRERSRDVSGLVLAFIAPVGIAALMGIALGGAEEFTTSLGYVDLDGGPVAERFVGLLEIDDLKAVIGEPEQYETEEALRDAVADGGVDTGIVIPEGLSAAEDCLPGDDECLVRRDGASTIVIYADPENAISAAVAEGVSEAFAGRQNALTTAFSTLVVVTGGQLPVDTTGFAQDLLARLDAAALGTDEVTGQLTALNWAAPAMAILFVFLTVLYGSTTLLAERHTGTLARLAVSPAHPWEILGGKLAALYIVAVAQLAALIVITSLVFDLDWGDPIAVAVLTLTTAGAAVGLTSVVVAFAETEEQARGIGAAIVFVLAVIGGQLVGGAVLPPVLDVLAQFTPNGQAQRGYIELMIAGSGGSLTTVTVPIIVTAATAAAGAGILFARGRKVLMA